MRYRTFISSRQYWGKQTKRPIFAQKRSYKSDRERERGALRGSRLRFVRFRVSLKREGMCDSSKMEAEVPISGRDNTTGKEKKKRKRKEILEKKKAIDEIIKSACSGGKDNLTFYPPYQHFHKNGLCLYLESGRGDKLSSQLKLYIRNLLKLNMEGPYGLEWPVEEKVKCREMVSPEARYVFVYEPPNENTDHIPKLVDRESTSCCVFDKGPIVGFVHYRFTIEEEIPVLYVYELQLHPCVQGKGLGAFLMELTGLIARKNCMGAVVLTVQKANSLALNFYTSKMRYSISAISPSRVDPLYPFICRLDCTRVMRFYVKRLLVKPKQY